MADRTPIIRSSYHRPPFTTFCE